MENKIQEPINSEQDDRASYDNAINEVNSPVKKNNKLNSNKNYDNDTSSSITSSQKKILQANLLNKNEQQYQQNNIKEINIEYNNSNVEDNNDNDDNNKMMNNRINWREKLIYIILITICLIYIIQDIFTRQQFAEKSAEFIVDIQDWKANQEFLYTVSIVVSDGSFVITALVALVVVLYGNNRIHTINYLMCFAFAASLLSTFKLFYNDPRPYMEFTDVQGEECSAEYGNPSGHAMLNFFADVYGISVMGNQFHRKYWYICLIIGIYLIYVGFTRIHLGVHGVNQVILGWVYAFGIFLIVRTIVFEKINKFLVYLAELEIKKVRSYCIKLICAYFFHSGMLIMLFALVKDKYEDPNDEYNERILQVCSAKNINSISNKYLYNKCFIDAGISGAAYGMILGIIYTSGSVLNCYRYGSFHKKIDFIKQIKRLILIAIIPGSIFGIFSLIFHFVNPSAIYWRFFFQMNIIPFICAFLIIFISPKLLYKFKLEIEGDFLKFDESSQQNHKQQNHPNQKRIIHFNANIDLSQSHHHYHHHNNSHQRSPNQQTSSIIECQLTQVYSSNLNIDTTSTNNSNHTSYLPTFHSDKNLKKTNKMNERKQDYNNNNHNTSQENSNNTTINTSTFLNSNKQNNKIRNEDHNNINNNDNSNILKIVDNSHYGQFDIQSNTNQELSVDQKINHMFNQDNYSNEESSVQNMHLTNNSMERRSILQNNNSFINNDLDQNSFQFGNILHDHSYNNNNNNINNIQNNKDNNNTDNNNSYTDNNNDNNINNEN